MSIDTVAASADEAPVASIPIDPELEQLLPALREVFPERTFRVDQLEEFRAVSEGLTEPIKALIVEAGVQLEEVTGPGFDATADDVQLLVFRPSTPAATPAPCVYFIHGGGLVAGNRYHSADPLTELASQYGVVGVSVEYRLAPEHRYPAQIEDCYAGLRTTIERAAELGIDPDRIIIGGASAGGGLAAALALMVRDRGEFTVAGALLVCPMLDDRDRHVSVRQHENGVIWNRASNRNAWDEVLGAGHAERSDISPYAAPARADDLRGLPPTFLDVGSAEPFRDETVEYASRLWAAGGRTELHVWAGGFHAFDTALPTAALSMASRAARFAWIERTLNLVR